jgi:hypothetical protein
MRHQIDVGISGQLPTGLGFFDPLHAASPGPALRLACPETVRVGSTGGFSMFRIHHGMG